jgi:protein SCO1/2
VTWLLALLLLILTGPACAGDAPGYTPIIGASINTSLLLTDASGQRHTLADYLAGKPALLLLGYHKCPNLCGVAQLDLADALGAAGLKPDQYRVVFASIDPDETATDAKADLDKLAAARPFTNLTSWRFLVGDAQSVAALAEALGVRFRKPAGSDIFIHPVVVSTVTPDARVARTFPGLDYDARDLRLALVEASEGRLGTLSDRVVLFCSGFDASTGRYTSAIMIGVRAAGLSALVLLGAGLVALERTRRA